MAVTLESLRKSVGKKNASSMVFAWLADLERVAGELDKALQRVDGGLTLYPNDISARLVRAKILIQLEAYEPCVEECERIIVMDPFNDDSYPTVVVQKAHLDGLGIDATELRKAGRENLRKVVQILPMAEVIAALMGMDVPSGDEELLYVATTKDKLHGASIMLLGDVLTEFCKDHGLDSICIIPSSKHEILLVKGAMDRAEIDAMIREVNETQVAEQDRLSDHGYWFTAA